jgi:hypothetical protein
MTEYNLPNPPALQPVNTLVDSYVKPRESTAGQQVAQLAQTLSGIRPEIGQYLQAGVENYENQETTQGIRWALKNASISSGDFSTATAGWSVPRILGASQQLAQHAADNYSLELNSALDALAKRGTPASPDEINNVIQPIRDRYMQQGQGYGSLWSKTFADYASHYEAGAMHNFQARSLDELSQQTLSNATADVAIESTALLSKEGDYGANFSQWLQSYFDPSHLHSPLSPTQKSEAIINGFRGAVVHALANQKFDVADHLIDGFQSVEVFPGAKLSETAQGSDTLQDMLRQSHYARVAANETDALARHQKEAAARKELLDFTLSQRALPLEQQQFTVPDNILRDFSEAGLSPADAQREHTAILQAPTKAAKAESQADVDRITVAATNAISDYRQAPDSGEAFNRMVSTLANLRNDPGAQGPQAKLFLDSRLAMVNELAKQHNNPLLTESYRQFQGGVRAEVSALDHALSDAKAPANADAGAALNAKLRKLGIQLDTSEGPQNARWSLPQLESDAQDAYLSAEHNLKSNGWQDPDALQKMRQGVLSNFRSKVQALIAPAKAAVESVNDDALKPVSMMGYDGTPTNRMVVSILGSRNMTDDAAPARTAGAYLLAPINEATSVVQKAHPTAGEASDILKSLPLNALRSRLWEPSEGQPRLSLAQDLVRSQLQDAFDSSTADLRKFEIDNAATLKAVADGGGAIPAESDPVRPLLVQWAKMRDTWRSLADVRGVTLDELKTIPKSWLMDEHTPFPKVPIFSTEDELSRGVASVVKDYGLTREQKLQFIAKQLELIRLRRLAVERAAVGFHNDDGLIPYPTGRFKPETGGEPGTPGTANIPNASPNLNVGELTPKPQQTLSNNTQ